MPRLGGLEALRRIRILDPGLKVVIMTANPEDIREEATSLGAAAVLAKPFERRELLQAFRSETYAHGCPGTIRRTNPRDADGDTTLRPSAEDPRRRRRRAHTRDAERLRDSAGLSGAMGQGWRRGATRPDPRDS